MMGGTKEVFSIHNMASLQLDKKNKHINNILRTFTENTFTLIHVTMHCLNLVPYK